MPYRVKLSYYILAYFFRQNYFAKQNLLVIDVGDSKNRPEIDKFYFNKTSFFVSTN